MTKLFLTFLTLLNTFLFSYNLEPTSDFLHFLTENEKTEMIDFLDSFPITEYKIYRTPGVGRFYVDDIDDCIKNCVRSGSPWEPYMLRLLRKHIKPGSTALDIGAHMGLHTVYMAKCIGNSGKIYAFEPQRKLFRELVMNVGLNHLNNIQVYRYALGNEEKTVEMNPSVALNEGGTSIGTGGDSVQLKRLDDFNFTNLSFMKIDVEGFENNVLDGARETILRNKPVIIIEIVGGSTYATAPQHIKNQIDFTKTKLKNLGYHVQRVSFHDYLATPY